MTYRNGKKSLNWVNTFHRYDRSIKRANQTIQPLNNYLCSVHTDSPLEISESQRLIFSMPFNLTMVIIPNVHEGVTRVDHGDVV